MQLRSIVIDQSHIHLGEYSIRATAMDPNATCYTIVNDDTLIDSGAAPSIPDFRNALQKGSDEVKLDTMRRIIVGTLNGQNFVSLPFPNASPSCELNIVVALLLIQTALLMPMIQYVLPNKNKQIKKMLHFYWE